MNPPLPKLVCEKEIQNGELDENEVIMEFIMDAQGNNIKKLRPIFIKSKPDREHVLYVDTEENLPDVLEENFILEREKAVDSYSESVSSNDELSNAVTILANSDSSEAADFEDAMVGLELDPKKIKITLCQIVTGLKTA